MVKLNTNNFKNRKLIENKLFATFLFHMFFTRELCNCKNLIFKELAYEKINKIS